jgi:hypothetical protein
MAGQVQLERQPELRRIQLLDELRGRLRAIDFDCIRDPTGARRDELCAVICRHERAPGDPLQRRHDAGVDAAGSGRIGFGVPVTLRDQVTGETVFCHIDCPPDARRQNLSPPQRHPPEHRVCCTSPLGNALLGRHEGELIEVHGGGRTMHYEIVSVG